MQTILKITKGLGIFILILLGFITFFILSFLLGYSIILLGWIKMGVIMSIFLGGGIYYALKRNDR